MSLFVAKGLLYFSGLTFSLHVPVLSHELPSLPRPNMKSENTGNVIGLKFENRIRTQPRTFSPIFLIREEDTTTTTTHLIPK